MLNKQITLHAAFRVTRLLDFGCAVNRAHKTGRYELLFTACSGSIIFRFVLLHWQKWL